MIRILTIFIALAAMFSTVQPATVQAQSAGYFAQLERDKIKCDRAGKVWDGRRCQAKGFFKPKLDCREGYQAVNGRCQKIHKPWNRPGCAGWKSACKAGSAWACGKYESICQVN